jgi:hypothetical protein
MWKPVASTLITELLLVCCSDRRASPFSSPTQPFADCGFAKFVPLSDFGVDSPSQTCSMSS